MLNTTIKKSQYVKKKTTYANAECIKKNRLMKYATPVGKSQFFCLPCQKVLTFGSAVIEHHFRKIHGIEVPVKDDEPIQINLESMVNEKIEENSERIEIEGIPPQDKIEKNGTESKDASPEENKTGEEENEKLRTENNVFRWKIITMQQEHEKRIAKLVEESQATAKENYELKLKLAKNELEFNEMKIKYIQISKSG